MATTVNNAFAEFLKTRVRLNEERNKIAKGSKTWLIGQIQNFPSDNKFPEFHPDLYIEYGSYARKTKIRPLDDIDIMFVMHAHSATYLPFGENATISNSGNFASFTGFQNENTIEINSIKVLNKFKEYLNKVPQYKKADIKRNQEAVTLELESYEWVFDIVPCFLTSSEADNRTYYLIPDGQGRWKKTDPRVDHQNIKDVQAAQEISIYDIVRLIKYWNNRATMPSASSYMIEIMVLNYFKLATRGQWIDLEFKQVLHYLHTAIHQPVYDPKNIQGNLNTLSWDQRNKISARALADYYKADEARTLEIGNEMKNAITKWAEIFGTEFPAYTENVTT